jgi:hypothetical protein
MTSRLPSSDTELNTAARAENIVVKNRPHTFPGRLSFTTSLNG